MSTPFLKFGKLMEKTWISIPMATFVSGLLYVNNGMAEEIRQLKIINEKRHHKGAGVTNLGDTPECGLKARNYGK
ncbi:uncharacterized protein EAE98_005867 [Botrytis deweyae]|uniref:Uncharacterized protein n=2 Tax=Botrytis TaxID=33196 RepID=A0A4Z1I5T1_9HELO|nr:uncharacterized protein EAE98_005867 [Botrytis deweyae]KAF7927485.1 hypothetical protein EAE98_005867 [Botrytis deweyae]KAF7941137.1 hypothetical protein EAE99_000774 [Botrytis elliptica]TGO56054.1 hypothetical protein BELL_1420g00010 [Botrytis elliptica]